MSGSLRMTCLFASILLATSAKAECYLVYQDTMTAPCSSSCCSSGIPMVLHYRDTWRSHVSNKVNHYRIEQLSDASCMAPPTCCTMRSVRHGSGKIVKMRYDGAPQRTHYVNTAISAYDPDTATGDDEIMTDSDMNNQY